MSSYVDMFAVCSRSNELMSMSSSNNNNNSMYSSAHQHHHHHLHSLHHQERTQHHMGYPNNTMKVSALVTILLSLALKNTSNKIPLTICPTGVFCTPNQGVG